MVPRPATNSITWEIVRNANSWALPTHTPAKSEAWGGGRSRDPPRGPNRQVIQKYREVGERPFSCRRAGEGQRWDHTGNSRPRPGPAPTCARWAAPSISRGNRVRTSNFTRHLFTGHLPILEEAGVPITTRPQTPEQGSPRTPHTHLAPALGTPRLCPAAPQLVHGSQVPAGRGPWCQPWDCGVHGQGRGHHRLLLEC